MRAAIPAQIASNTEWIDQWKVLIVKAHGTSGREDLTILGEPVVAAPGSACTETYLVIGRTDNETEARRLAAYMRTRFVRFLVSLRKITQNITRVMPSPRWVTNRSSVCCPARMAPRASCR